MDFAEDSELDPQVAAWLEELAQTEPDLARLWRSQIERTPEAAAMLKACLVFGPELVQGQLERQREYVDALQGHRKTLDLRSWENSNAFDKLIVTLSTGIVGLSIVFIQQLGIGSHVGMLVSAWGMLGVCVVSIIVSISLASTAVEHQIEAIDDQIADPGNPLAGIEGASGIPKQWARQATVIATRVALAAFVMGLVMFTIFAGQRVAEREADQQGLRAAEFRDVEQGSEERLEAEPAATEAGQRQAPQEVMRGEAVE